MIPQHLIIELDDPARQIEFMRRIPAGVSFGFDPFGYWYSISSGARYTGFHSLEVMLRNCAERLNSYGLSLREPE